MSVRAVGKVWAYVGLGLLLGSAIVRVAPFTIEAIRAGLTLPQWGILLVWSVFMLVSEGRDGFQKRFAPRFVARANVLAKNGSARELLLAPLFCMAFFAAPAKRIVASWAVTVGIIMLILIVHQLSQPWRGIIDSGVVVGLAYGLLVTYWQGIFSAKNRSM